LDKIEKRGEILVVEYPDRVPILELLVGFEGENIRQSEGVFFIGDKKYHGPQPWMGPPWYPNLDRIPKKSFCVLTLHGPSFRIVPQIYIHKKVLVTIWSYKYWPVRKATHWIKNDSAEKSFRWY